MSLLNPLATALSKVYSSGARPAMEFAFSQLQNSFIRRLNSEIEDINNRSGDVAREHQLKSENAKLGAQIKEIQQYTFDNQANMGKLGELATMVADLGDVFGSDGDALDVTAQEVTDFTTKRDEVIAKINTLRVLSFPDTADYGRIRDLLDQVDTLQGLTPDVGAVDPEGTENPNNNRVIADYVTELANKVSVALTVSEDTTYLGTQMYENANRIYSSNEAELLQMTQNEQAQRVQDIENLKIQYANLLKAASLSNEVALYYTEGLGQNLNGVNQPASGSVLNLFS